MHPSKVRILNFDERYHAPHPFPGLTNVVFFPGAENRDNAVPNSSVWVFDKNSEYLPGILGNDVGCGVAAFITRKFDYKRGADAICAELKGKGILGRGNHFVDICDRIAGGEPGEPDTMVLLIHTDGKQGNICVPQTYEAAIDRQRAAEQFRIDLGARLLSNLHLQGRMLGNWTHNSVEMEERAIYRKGAIKAPHNKLSLLLTSIAEPVCFYTAYNPTPFDSMPHGTGRSGPRGTMKVSLEQSAELRRHVYIPTGITDASLRSEHWNCYNTSQRCCKTLSRYMLCIGCARVLAYVGKV